MLLAGVFVLALGIRLVFLFQVWPKLNAAADIDWYRSVARNLVAGNGYVAEQDPGHLRLVLTRTPVYPVFLAALMTFGGDRLVLFLIVQCILGAATCAVTALLTARWLPWKWACAAGGLVAIDPNSVMRCADLRDETLFALLLVLGVCMISWHGSRLWVWLASGLVWSVAALCRPGMAWLGFVPVVVGLAWRVRGACLFAFLGMYLSLLCCWATRNHVVTGQWMISTAVTENLLLQRAASVEGARTGSTRDEMRARLYREYGDVEFFHDRDTLANNLGRYRGAARDILFASPLLTLRQMAVDVAKVLLAPGKVNLAHMMKNQPRPSRWWPPFYSAGLVIAFILSIYGAVKLGRSGLLLMLLVPSVLMVSLGSSRFRTQITPMLATLTVIAMYTLSWRGGIGQAVIERQLAKRS